MKITFLIAVSLLAGGTMANASDCCAPKTVPACCAKDEPTTIEFGDKSLYQTESKWTTDANKQIKLAELKGRPQVVVMFFASCQYACPILVHDLTRTQAALEP